MFLSGLVPILLVSNAFGVVINQDTTFSGQLSLPEIENEIQINPEVSTNFTVGDITNYGTISLVNSGEDEIAQYSLTGQFLNEGQMFIYSSSSETTIYMNSSTWLNTNLMVFSGEVTDNVVPKLKLSGGSLTNYGDLCLINQEFEGPNGFYGDGCIQLIGNSTFNYLGNSPSTSRTIILYGPGTSLTYQPGGNQYVLAGFGGGSYAPGANSPTTIGNTIISTEPVENAVYNDRNGVLTISSGGHCDYFYIGGNYRGQYILLGQADGSNILNAVYYAQPLPGTFRPTNCGTCPPAPAVAPTTSATA